MPADLSEHERWMALALKLARRGRGKVEPNPMVGAVVVKNGRLVGEGYHQRFGGPHAEPNALRDAGPRARGATVYVSLEPCAHYGKTPPCADALIAAGVARVVFAVRDPFPQTNGAGARKLREAGVEVVEGVLEEQAARLNAAFFKWVRTGRPYVTLKWAMTLDGKIAARFGDSKWITGEAARRYAHRLRAWNQAVLVGVGTVLQDDPLLTCRLARGRDPLRIVLDSRLRTPPSSQLARTAKETPLLLAATRAAAKSRREALERAGAEVLIVRTRRGRVDLEALLDELGRRGISTLLVEGGAETHAAFFDAGLADRVAAFIAPKLIAGADAPSPIAGRGAARMAGALALENPACRKLGDDWLIEGDLAR